MEKRVIPNTSFRVSTICLGTMTFGTPVAEKEAVALVHAAIDKGINFIDTANMYEGYTRYVGSAGGVAEEILGKALLNKRSQVVLATKVGMKIGPADDDQGLSPAHINREIERSLKRLNCSDVDLYYMHKPDPNTPLVESAAAFDHLVKAGKVRAWAVSNFSADQLAQLLKTCDENGLCRPVAIQPPYSLINRAVEAELLPLCERENIAVIPYRVLEGGILTGKYHRGEAAPADSRQAQKPEWTLALSDENFAILDRLESEAALQKLSLKQYALQKLLSQPKVVSLVLGVKRSDQLDDLIAAVGL